MKLLLVSDLHLTDNPRDAYRFRIFGTLQRVVSKYRIDHVIILGDLTDAKDHHSAILANQIADSLQELSACCNVIVLRGNHDGVDPSTPFFRWLDHQANISFITHPAEVDLDGKSGLFLPHTSVKEGYNGEYDFNKYDYIFVHQTFHGAKGENGRQLSGLSPTVFGSTKARIYSGDVHVPQRLGRCEYVGSPYHIHFGDPFDPRLLIDDGRDVKELMLKTVRKHSLSITHPEQLEDLKVREGDQIKVEVALFRGDFGRWADFRKQVKLFAGRAKVELCGVTLVERVRKKINSEDSDKHAYLADPKSVFDAFCSANREHIDDKLKAAGEELL